MDLVKNWERTQGMSDSIASNYHMESKYIYHLILVTSIHLYDMDHKEINNFEERYEDIETNPTHASHCFAYFHLFLFDGKFMSVLMVSNNSSMISTLDFNNVVFHFLIYESIMFILACVRVRVVKCFSLHGRFLKIIDNLGM